MGFWLRVSICWMIAALLVGCGADGPTQSDPEALLNALIAPPSDAEIAVAKAAFDAQDYTRTGSGLVELDRRDGLYATLSLVAYESEGSRVYGIITRPKTPGVYPVMLMGLSVEDGLYASTLDHPLAFAFVQVASGFRGEPVHWFGETYLSEGQPSPWDGDVTDALNMLTTMDDVAEADLLRLVAFGGSRGGAVALLAAARRPGFFNRAVVLFAPTDMFDPVFHDDLRAMVNGTEDPRPGVAFLKREVVDPYLSGSLSLGDARQALLRRSVIYFADRLPPIQIHHGTADEIVPISQSDRLASKLEEAHVPVEYFQYVGRGHDPLLGDELLPRVLAFLQ